MDERDDHGRELSDALAQLQRDAITAAVRGDGPARFVFAERGHRATEFYRGDNGWLVELWSGEAMEPGPVDADGGRLVVPPVVP
jgi:hypothetical protein